MPDVVALAENPSEDSEGFGQSPEVFQPSLGDSDLNSEVFALSLDGFNLMSPEPLPAIAASRRVPIRAETRPAFLLGKQEQRAKVSWSWLERDVPHLAETRRGLEKLILDMPEEPRKALVHGDYSQFNVLTNDRLEVSAVLDFSVYTVVGDYRTDVACAVFFPEVSKAVRPSYLRFLRRRAARMYGKDIEDDIRLYKLFYAFYNADNYHKNTAYQHFMDAAFADSGFTKLAVAIDEGDWPVYERQVLRFLELPLAARKPANRLDRRRFVGTYRSEEGQVCTIRLERRQLVIDGLPHVWPNSPLTRCRLWHSRSSRCRSTLPSSKSHPKPSTGWS